MPEYLWKIKERPRAELTNDLAQKLNISNALAGILIQRGVDSFQKAKNFFRPSLQDLHDPFLMKDMDKASERILDALERGEEIMIYGDYDVDGTTAVSVLYLFIKSRTNGVHYYVPDRYTEGYGLSIEGIQTARELDCSLIIALDCGVKANEAISYSNSLGIDVIVCDHHIPGENLPEALAILNPKQEGCSYPFKELSGCGIGFKLIQALSKRSDRFTKPPEEFLDFVMVSIAADIVPMTGENRVLAFYGLEKINKDPNIGLRALLKIAGLIEKDKLTISNIVFGIAPRINAAGRMKHGFAAIQVMISENLEEAMEKGQLIQQQNQDRKHLDEETTREALDQISELRDHKFSSVVYSENWHHGVLGIVASRCIEKFYRPTIVLSKKGDLATGSARSIKGFNLYETLEECDDLLTQWGGHQYAAGLSLPIANIPKLQDRFEKLVQRHFNNTPPKPVIEIDSEILLENINSGFYSILEQMEPHGPGNMRPVFISKGLEKRGPHRMLKEKHLKAYLAQTKDGPVFEGIGFQMEDLDDLVSKNDVFDVVYSIIENNFRGERKLELEIRDMKKFDNGAKS